ncbi:MAG TPA: lysozyme inhibitor LprI family protein [Candidatus Udaeobacter sp.]
MRRGYLETVLLVRCAALLFWLLSPVAQIHAQMQAAMNAQARADFARADVDLNKTYQAVLAKLPTAEKQKLREAQRAWIASRDAEAARAAKEAEGGSMAPTLRYEAMTRLTRERIKELKTMMGNGTASPTKPAAASVTPSPASTHHSARRLAVICVLTSAALTGRCGRRGAFGALHC